VHTDSTLENSHEHGGPELPGPIVSSSWLVQHLHHPNIVVADVRWYLDGRRGETAYDAGHIPGAVFMDLDINLSGPRGVGPGRHPLPSPEAFATGMARLGISDDSVVIAYDDAGGSIAARAWWMLTSTGHAAAVLDGGISTWTGALSQDLPAPLQSRGFTSRPWPITALADAVAVDWWRQSPDAVVLDARSADRYRGEPNPIDTRLGHIPGAVNAPWAANLDPQTGRFRSADELRAQYAAHGVSDDVTVVCQCGSGVTACHDVLALRIAGFRGQRLYPGSWSDWCADPHRPTAMGTPG
jgi:thiosulfate/3-mercaptopyruvate sulfurtransferase